MPQGNNIYERYKRKKRKRKSEYDEDLKEKVEQLNVQTLQQPSLPEVEVNCGR